MRESGSRVGGLPCRDRNFPVAGKNPKIPGTVRVTPICRARVLERPLLHLPEGANERTGVSRSNLGRTQHGWQSAGRGRDYRNSTGGSPQQCAGFVFDEGRQGDDTCARRPPRVAVRQVFNLAPPPDVAAGVARTQDDDPPSQFFDGCRHFMHALPGQFACRKDDNRRPLCRARSLAGYHSAAHFPIHEIDVRCTSRGQESGDVRVRGDDLRRPQQRPHFARAIGVIHALVRERVVLRLSGMRCVQPALDLAGRQGSRENTIPASAKRAGQFQGGKQCLVDKKIRVRR